MMHQRAQGGSDIARLEDYLRAVQRRKLLVLTLAVLGVIAAYLYAQRGEDTYTATSSVLIRSTPVGARVPGQLDPPNLEREREVLTSSRVANAVADSLGGPTQGNQLVRGLSVDFRPDSDVLFVRYTSPDPERAAAVSDSFAAAYVAQREGEAQNYYSALEQSTAATRDELTQAIEAAFSEREDLRADRAEVIESGGDVTEIDAAVALAGANASSLSGRLRATEAELLDLEKQDSARSAAAEQLRPALVPSQPNGVGTSYLLLAGLALGVVGGVVLAFLMERLDTTAREDDDIALALGQPVLGSVPTLGLSIRGASSLVMLSSGGSARLHAAREAFRRLRTSVQFLNTSNGVSSILITSSTPGEGKSVTAANLSIALAQNGASVVLINADMRRPVLEKLMGIDPAQPGLSEYLSDAAELAPVPAPGITNLWLIPSGRKVNNPGELLNSDRFERLLKELEREGVHYVVIDTPPVLSTADAVSAARVVDGAIVVVDTERTDTTDLLRVRADLARTGAKILGAVMNRTKFTRRGFFRRRDHYTY
jgi:capsular exopolysaccharide synthesis family protein